MVVEFPNFKTRNAFYIFQETAKKSGYLDICIDAEESAKGDGYRYDVGFYEPLGEGCHTGSSVDMGSESDIMAIHHLLQEMILVKDQIEQGLVSEKCSITRRSDKYEFNLLLWPESFYSKKKKDDGTCEILGHRVNSPSANEISISLLTSEGSLSVGSMKFYSGIKSALLLAHDLEVLMALMEGKPDLKIIEMHPKVAINGLTQEEKAALMGQLETPDFGDLYEQEKEESSYVLDLRIQAGLVG